MKKIFQIVTVLTLVCSSASAALIHSFHVKDKGKDGFDDVGIYSGFFIERKWCLNPGKIKCPWLCGGGEFIRPNGEAGNASPDVAIFEKQFIKRAMNDADQTTEKSGLITEVFEVNGQKVILTAKFSKDANNFFFDVVKNNSYEENLKELSAIEYVK